MKCLDCEYLEVQDNGISVCAYHKKGYDPGYCSGPYRENDLISYRYTAVESKGCD